MASFLTRFSNKTILPGSVNYRFINRGVRSATFTTEKLEAEPSTNAVDHEDMPDSNISNPYTKEKQQCVLCKHNVQLDYKNPRLLSQFVSQFTGKIYGKHVTGLCSEQQKRLKRAIEMSQHAGFMPYVFKNIKYLKDPKLFDISNVGKKM